MRATRTAARGAKRSMRFAYIHLDIGGNDNVSGIMISEDVGRQGVAIVQEGSGVIGGRPSGAVALTLLIKIVGARSLFG